MENQQLKLGSARLVQTGNHPLATLFFAMGALHIYGMMRSRTTQTPLVQKTVSSFSPAIDRCLRVGLLAAVVALIIEILIF